MPKGSASVILDILSKTASLPGLAAIRDAVKFVANAGADERAVRKALDAKPAIRRVLTTIEADFPVLASSLGIAAILQPTKEEETQ